MIKIKGTIKSFNLVSLLSTGRPYCVPLLYTLRHAHKHTSQTAMFNYTIPRANTFRRAQVRVHATQTSMRARTHTLTHLWFLNTIFKETQRSRPFTLKLSLSNSVYVPTGRYELVNNNNVARNIIPLR